MWGSLTQKRSFDALAAWHFVSIRIAGDSGLLTSLQQDENHTQGREAAHWTLHGELIDLTPLFWCEAVVTVVLAQYLRSDLHSNVENCQYPELSASCGWAPGCGEWNVISLSVKAPNSPMSLTIQGWCDTCLIHSYKSLPIYFSFSRRLVCSFLTLWLTSLEQIPNYSAALCSLSVFLCSVNLKICITLSRGSSFVVMSEAAFGQLANVLELTMAVWRFEQKSGSCFWS